MEKKTMMVMGVMAVLIVAAVGAFLLTNSGASKSTGIKIIDLQKNATSASYSPLDEAAVYNGSYPLARFLYLYTDGVPNSTSSTYKWLEYIYDADKGQKAAGEIGFFPLPPADLAAMKAQLAAGTTDGKTGSITQKGSDTMYEVCLKWADGFKKETGITISITGGGSGPGISAITQGTVDVAQASRAIKPSEIAAAQANGVDVKEWKVALDGIAIVVEKSNPITHLTMDQLKGIYNGTITNWNQVGGADRSIALYGRNDASGTYAYFQEVVLGSASAQYAGAMQKFAGNAQIVVEVQNNKGGIGYVGIGYAQEATSDGAEMESGSDQLAMVSRLD